MRFQLAIVVSPSKCACGSKRKGSRPTSATKHIGSVREKIDVKVRDSPGTFPPLSGKIRQANGDEGRTKLQQANDHMVAQMTEILTAKPSLSASSPVLSLDIWGTSSTCTTFSQIRNFGVCIHAAYLDLLGHDTHNLLEQQPNITVTACCCLHRFKMVRTGPIWPVLPFPLATSPRCSPWTPPVPTVPLRTRPPGPSRCMPAALSWSCPRPSLPLNGLARASPLDIALPRVLCYPPFSWFVSDNITKAKNK